MGYVANSDTGKPVIVDDIRLTAGEFEKIKISETLKRGKGSLVTRCTAHSGRRTGTRSARMAPIEFAMAA